MPRSPRIPPRRPIDEPTLRAALRGEPQALGPVIRAVGMVVGRVLTERRRHDDGPPHAHDGSHAHDGPHAAHDGPHAAHDGPHAAHDGPHAAHDGPWLLGAWRSLSEGGFAVLAQWAPGSGISFEQHVADAVCTWLDAHEALQACPANPHAWTPTLVAAALDDGDGALARALARYVDIQLRACALRTLRSHRQRVDVTAQAQDLAQDFALTLFARDGATLRGWDPGRGRTTLSSYLYFIARRDFLRRLDRGHGRHGKVIPLDGAREQALPVAPEAQARLTHELSPELVFQYLRARLDEDERALLELVRQGVSAKEGAQALGIRGNAYYQRKHRLVQRMKALMAELDDRREP